MAEEVKIPPFGESITTANVSRWHFEDGAQVRKGDALVSLETDKVSQELDAEHDGVLKILVQEDEEVEIGSIIAEIDTAAASGGNAQSEPPSEPSSVPDSKGAEGALGQCMILRFLLLENRLRLLV